MIVKIFFLTGYSNIYNQVIVGGSEIKIYLHIEDYNGIPIIVDISNYSNIGSVKLVPFSKSKNITKFSAIVKVDFLGDLGIKCGKNNECSRVNLVINNYKYYSNAIGNYEYNSNLNLFNTCDHHLGVYNMFIDNYKLETIKISKFDLYKNDIIFFNRSLKKNYLFIELTNDINTILLMYINNLKKSEKSVFYLNIFKNYVDDDILKKISQILSICKEGSFYIYNIDYKYLKEYKFDKKYYLYNYHFKPVFNK